MRHMSSMLIVVFSITSVSARGPVAAENGKTVTLPRSGYAIEVLDPGPAKAVAFDSFKMFLPPQGGFASNIDVQHQPYRGTLSDYAAPSVAAIQQANLTIGNARVENGAYMAEATGKVAGIDIELHFYFKAIKSGDNVILATATIPSSRWDTEKARLLPIVDSLVAVNK